MLCGCSKIIVKPGAKVITIEPAQNASTIEWVVELFSMASGLVCALRAVGEVVCSWFFLCFLCVFL